jgi:hypothetical protein
MMRRRGRTTFYAGPLRLTLVNGELRYLQVGGVEILRRVYIAMRD